MSGASPVTSPAPPSGEVTFLFTDVEGSSVLWDAEPEAMASALTEHDRRIRAAIAEHAGYVFTTAGDSFAVAFGSAADALAAAVDAQRRLAQPTPGPELRVRMALHTGVATERDGDYFGPVVNRCARLMSAGHGGQILLSETTAALVGDAPGDGFELIDLGEHGLKDLSRPERVYQLAHADLAAHFAPLRTMTSVAATLPIQLTSFVGRGQELAEVDKLLASARLVTLVGSGGAGKTRLALQVAADATEHYPGGVGLVELASLTDASLVLDTIAAACGVRSGPDAAERAGGSGVAAVAAKIGDRPTLLVVDNCEHLVAPVAAVISELLSASSGLSVLATSRERLGVPGEVAYRVPPLAVPARTVAARVARRYDAVQLFTERAVLAKPDFAVTDANVAAVLAICRRLDGIPLALELAAARVQVLSPDRIVAKLDERFRLLGRAQRTAPGRHETLRAAIDWSHDLLDEQEAALFRRLAVFSGSFDLDAVEGVGAGEPLDEFEILDLVAALVDKSMVAVQEGAGSETRYRLLESMRQYAHERLAAAGEEPELGGRHFAVYVGVAQALADTKQAGGLGDALRGLAQDRDNIRAALEYGLVNQELEGVARIVGAVGTLWYSEGSLREGIGWCERLFRFDPDLPNPLLAAALHTFGTLLGSWSHPDEGIVMLEREAELRRTMGDPLPLASALNNIGNLWNDLGRGDLAEPALREAVDLFRAAGESATIALSSLGYGRLHAGHYDEAAVLFAEARADAVQAGNRYGVAVATTYLGQCAVLRGRPAAARSHLAEARRGFAEEGITPGVAYADFNLAMADRAEGDPAAAARRLLLALENPDAHWFLATEFWVIQVAASLIADTSVAAELLGAADAYYRAAKEVQPVFVNADLDATRDALAARLGRAACDAHFAVGAALDVAAAVRQAMTELTILAEGAAR